MHLAPLLLECPFGHPQPLDGTQFPAGASSSVTPQGIPRTPNFQRSLFSFKLRSSFTCQPQAQSQWIFVITYLNKIYEPDFTG